MIVTDYLDDRYRVSLSIIFNYVQLLDYRQNRFSRCRSRYYCLPVVLLSRS